MTREDKELLLKDLCARLYYKVRLHISNELLDKDDTILGISLIEGLTPYITHNKIISTHSGYAYSVEEVKPYLRPMSSMTDEERKEYIDIVKNTIEFYNCPKSEDVCFFVVPIDWLNAHHFDYRGLIEKGLALEAPEDIYNIK